MWGQIVAGTAGIPGVKSKLQYLHAGIAAFLYQLADRISHIAQILGNDFFFSQRMPHRLKELDSRAFFPVSLSGVICVCRDGEIFVKASEMVDAHHIVEAVAVGQTANPPAVAGISVVFPVVEGVAPQLSGSGKAIGRTACYGQRTGCFHPAEKGLGLAHASALSMAT